MDLQKLDIVYFVKDSAENEELRYSLRSVEKNFPHRKVWFIGGKPQGLRPDQYLPINQRAETKWANTSLLLQAACKCDDISDDFVLFNDDFFVMKQVTSLPYYSDGSLERRIMELKDRHTAGAYISRMEDTLRMLKRNSCPTFNYAVHYPMIINKKEMLETFTKFSFGEMWRSLYGNHHRKLPEYRTDCKVYSLGIDDLPTTELEPFGDSEYLSTTDNSFKFGAVGTYIRNQFKEKSRFEV